MTLVLGEGNFQIWLVTISTVEEPAECWLRLFMPEVYLRAQAVQRKESNETVSIREGRLKAVTRHLTGRLKIESGVFETKKSTNPAPTRPPTISATQMEWIQ